MFTFCFQFTTDPQYVGLLTHYNVKSPICRFWTYLLGYVQDIFMYLNFIHLLVIPFIFSIHNTNKTYFRRVMFLVHGGAVG
jgi:hypothetical protein